MSKSARFRFRDSVLLCHIDLTHLVDVLNMASVSRVDGRRQWLHGAGVVSQTECRVCAYTGGGLYLTRYSLMKRRRCERACLKAMLWMLPGLSLPSEMNPATPRVQHESGEGSYLKRGEHGVHLFIKKAPTIQRPAKSIWTMLHHHESARGQLLLSIPFVRSMN